MNKKIAMILVLVITLSLVVNVYADEAEEHINNITSIKGIDLTGNIDNRDLIYSLNKEIYIPKGVYIRCNLLPEDDISIFKGEGKLLTCDPWGNEHVFDIALANGKGKNQLNSIQKIANAMKHKEANIIKFGFVGDSISDGAWSKIDNGNNWKPNPISTRDSNLLSSDYDHSASGKGGNGSWVAVFGRMLNGLIPNAKYFNASSNGKKLIDGWAYRNFDYGFFKNKKYTLPDVVVMAMGVNDVRDSNWSEEKFENELLKFAKKCWGYGCSLVVVDVGTADEDRIVRKFKEDFAEKYPSVTYVDLYKYKANLIDDSKDKKAVEREMYFKTQLGANEMDYIHPQQIGHDIMGRGFFTELFKD